MGWGGLIVPKATPREVVERIAADTRRVMQDPALQQRIVDRGLIPDTRGQKEWSEFAVPMEGAKVSVHTADGRSYTHEVNAPLGSLANPMTDAQLETKVRELAAFGAPGCDVGALIDTVWEMEMAKQVRLAC